MCMVNSLGHVDIVIYPSHSVQGQVSLRRTTRTLEIFVSITTK